jgi:hypothetical protein
MEQKSDDHGCRRMAWKRWHKKKYVTQDIREIDVSDEITRTDKREYMLRNHVSSTWSKFAHRLKTHSVLGVKVPYN